MQPDIFATPSEPLSGGGKLSNVTEHALGEFPREGTGATAVVASGYASTLTVAAANGHANGPMHALLPTSAGNHPNWSAGAVTVAAASLHPAALPALRVSREVSLYLRCGKRALDLVGAVIALILSVPLMLVASILIKLESRGPVLYRSMRIGRHGRPFTFYKLRSMVDGAERARHRLSHLNECDGPVFKMSNDPRVTRIGRFLRTTSIDEIPQFINVLRGEMSLVGPRPPLPEEVAQYEPWQMRRLDVRPGITCLWQISGRSRIGFKEWMRLDLEYIKHQSFRMDLRILLRTIPAVLSREGAY
jgi:exopolysaccharide biosynthesis polyprenyl glycosylphosphotransferase